MALLWFDGFDHYGLDTARMTEGPYDLVDAAFTLSEVNPRTGTRCLRRSSAQNSERVLKDLGGLKESFGSGLAISLSQLPQNGPSYVLFSLLDSALAVQVVIDVQSDGSISVKRGGLLGPTVAISAPGVAQAGQYAHYEFGN
jgi:hypothetical protein